LLRGGDDEKRWKDGKAIQFGIRFVSPPLRHQNFRRRVTKVCRAGATMETQEYGKTIQFGIRFVTPSLRHLKLSARSDESLLRGGDDGDAGIRKYDSIFDSFRLPVPPSLKLSARSDESLPRRGDDEKRWEGGNTIRFLIRFVSPPLRHLKLSARGTGNPCQKTPALHLSGMYDML